MIHQGKRIEWITSLRALSAIAIVLLHVVAGWFTNITSMNGVSIYRVVLDEVCIQMLVRWAVPCFIMITGCLLLNPNKNITLDKIKKYIIRMVFVLLVFGLGYCFIESMYDFVKCGGDKNASLITVIYNSILNLLQGKSWAHMWYIYMLLGLYIITPILRLFTKYADDETAKFILIMLYILTLAIPTFNKLLNISIVKFIPITTECVFYYMAGYYVSCTKLFKNSLIKAQGILGGILFFISLVLRLYEVNFSVGQDNMFVAMYSILIFKTACNSDNMNKLAQVKIIDFIAKYSFGIYLLHPLFLNIVNKGLDIYPDILPLGVGEFVFFIYALVASALLSCIISKVPLLRKIM